MSNNKEKQERRKENTQRYHDRLKETTGKKFLGVDDFIKDLTSKYGWDRIAKNYAALVQSFEEIGVDVSDADIIFAKYDDPIKLTLDDFAAMRNDNTQQEVEYEEDEDGNPIISPSKRKVKNNKELQEEVEKRKQNAERYYDRLKENTGKKYPSLDDIVKDYTSKYGWDWVVKNYKGIVPYFEAIGVDVSDAEIIFAKYDDPANLFLSNAEKLSNENTEPQEESSDKIEETTKKVNKKIKLKADDRKNILKINGEVVDSRTTNSLNKMAVSFIAKKRINDKLYVDADKLRFMDMIPNHWILDVDFINMLRKDSIDGKSKVTLHTMDQNDSILFTNNTKEVRPLKFIAIPGKPTDLGEDFTETLDIDLEPGGELTFERFMNIVKKEFEGNDEIIEEFKKQYVPMVYSYKGTPIAREHNMLFYYQDGLDSKNEESIEDDKLDAMLRVRDRRDQVFYYDGSLPISIDGTGYFQKSVMRDNKGNKKRKTVSEGIGKVKGYKDRNIGKIGVLHFDKKLKKMIINFPDKTNIDLDKTIDNTSILKYIVDYRNKIKNNPVQILPQENEDASTGVKYKLNYLSYQKEWPNATENIVPSQIKDSFKGYLFAKFYNDNEKDKFVRDYFHSIGMTQDKAIAILEEVGKETIFLNSLSYKGKQKYDEKYKKLKNSKSKEELESLELDYDDLVPNINVQDQIYEIGIIDSDFNIKGVDYQIFLSDILHTNIPGFDIKTYWGKQKTIFTVNPKVYTDIGIIDETQADYQSLEDETSGTKKYKNFLPDVEDESNKTSKIINKPIIQTPSSKSRYIVKNNKELQEEVERRKADTQRYHDRLQETTGKKFLEVDDFVKDLTSKYGWDWVVKHYKNIIPSLEAIGVDVSDAYIIFAKYDDPSKIFSANSNFNTYEYK